MTEHEEVNMATPPWEDEYVAGPVTVIIVPFVQAAHLEATLQPLLEVPSTTMAGEPAPHRTHPW